MSYSSTWQYLQQLTTQARYTEVIRTGRWIWMYDNLNIHQRVRHERTGERNNRTRIVVISNLVHTLDHHSDMLNLTSRIAVQIQNLPDWEVDWTDNKPQKLRSSLTCSDFLPDESDAAALHKHAEQYVMEVLVTEFSSLHDLQPYLPPRECLHPVKKSAIVPMKILFKDEKYKAQTIEILSDLMRDADLTGNPQVNNTTQVIDSHTCICITCLCTITIP